MRKTLTFPLFSHPVGVRVCPALLSLWARRWDMKKSRYTEEQIAFALKQADMVQTSVRCALVVGLSRSCQ